MQIGDWHRGFLEGLGEGMDAMVETVSRRNVGLCDAMVAKLDGVGDPDLVGACMGVPL